MENIRIDRLESHREIEALIANYAHAFDNRDMDLFLSIWDDDCTLIAAEPLRTIHGATALAHLVEQQLWPTWQWSMHIITNCTVKFEDGDADSARSLSNVCCIGHNHQGIGQALVGSYRDIFVRRSGIWKLASREVDMRWGGSAETLLAKIEAKSEQ
ncbi:nuclear transport factor 2 family protein [Sphingobium chlorophenolicum]|uniref:Dehydrochlorinase n=1 Tax=Sphingobium chlorophenolicum TaxID=46429 RepID=A0A081RFE8_SPHCR|nr:nuclear transport factor 2 family protein [Sphingobium chlorophenolicum]KEQ53921.1 Dehydrochlorinase [Sphingobium chlorophenolicum]